MAHISWSEKLNVNVRELDDEHKIFIEKINILHQAMLDNKGREAQKPIIDAMVDYASEHLGNIIPKRRKTPPPARVSGGA